jgi:hypothetical protein
VFRNLTVKQLLSKWGPRHTLFREAFHVEPDGETTETERLFEEGLLLGLLVGEGHFGGDGRQPQVTLRMHVQHEALFRWLVSRFPGGKLYGPYDHGGRRYYQWMARGAFLRDELVPLLENRLTPEIDAHVFERFTAMCRRYGLGPAAPRRAPGGASLSTPTT